MPSRRQFLGSSAGFAGGMLLPVAALWSQRALAQSAPVLDPSSQPKFVNQLPNPLAPNYIMQPSGVDASGLPRYDVRVEQILHDAGLVDPATGRRLRYTAWAYGTPSQAPVTPGYTFNMRSGQGAKVRFWNALNGIMYPTDVPVDQTLHWADPMNSGNPANVVYTGPVPLTAHQHGGDTDYLSDGLPDAWATPDNQITGRLFNPQYSYDNTQEAAHLWYHDHTVGATRLNVYMGLAGHYFIRDANEDALKLPKYPYEVPLVIQDRTFLANGELYYEAMDPTNPLAPIPTHMPENFGNVIMVNGVAWPVLDVEPRKYRFRILNGSDARFYDMTLSNNMPFMQIGSDLGMLNSPVPMTMLSVAPGERCDVVIDFSKSNGQTIVLANSAVAPYPSGDPVDGNTSQVMAFRVSKPLSGAPDRPLPTNLRPLLGPVPTLPKEVRTRKILLFEGTDTRNRLQTMGGIVDASRPTLNGTLVFTDPITENPKVGDTEVWEFYNTTGDAHPIHMHLVDYRILNRQKFGGKITPKTNSDGSIGGVLDPDSVHFLGQPKTPAANEQGKKDTAKMFPGEVTRVKATFKRPGEYVFHCHILSHEDHEMMRPFYVGQIPAGR